MSKTEEFEAWMDHMKEILADKMQMESETFTTAGGKEFHTSGLNCIKLLLQGCSNEQMKELCDSETIEMYDRLAKNFITTNTLEDLIAFIKHNTALRLMNLIFNK